MAVVILGEAESCRAAQEGIHPTTSAPRTNQNRGWAQFALAIRRVNAVECARMKSFIGWLMLIVVVAALVLTVVYHTSVNAELRFETRDTHVEYINTRRSYRPRNVPPPAQPLPPAINLPDDDIAEEVTP